MPAASLPLIARAELMSHFAGRMGASSMGIFRRNRARAQHVVAMDEGGVQKVSNGQVLEAVTWDTLTAVEIMTTSDGPFSEDMFWVLHGSGETGIVVPSGLAPSGFLERLQALPGFDNEAVIKAAGSTSQEIFPCWKALHG